MKGNLKKITGDYIRLLKKAYPDAKTALHFKTPLEMLVATILSAQCTDERVNKVTARLFKKYRKCRDYLKVPEEELQQDIRSTGFYRNKAKNIRGACKILRDKFDEKMPRTMEEMLTLPGVARKTANVVLGNVYGIMEGVVVDTHVSRLAKRMGLSKEKTPKKIEKDLMTIVPKKDWLVFSNLLVSHGRKVCKARGPKCIECVLNKICPSAFKV
ncbi:endonuclease III [Candidatus Gracilibacteria bacterium]|nr:endonuclease III [Candidatus Gracilibacteria bacterium]